MTAPRPELVARLTFRENVVMRLIGLFIFVAPNRGSRFIADVVPRVNAKVRARRIAARPTSCRCGKPLDENGEHDGGYGAFCG